MYNNELYDVMKKHKGYWFKKEKCWIFPEKKLDDIKSDIEKLNHKVSILGSKIEQNKNVFDDPDVVSVFGTCKKCGEGGFVSKEGICSKCR